MFIDVHGHAYRRPGPPSPHTGEQWFSTPAQLVERHAELGIDRCVLLPIVNAEVYLPQSNDDILDMAAENGGHFIPFCNIDPRVISNSADAPLEVLLGYYKERGCRGVGEVMPNMRFLDPLMQNLFGHVEAVDLPLTFDVSVRLGGDYGLVDDPGMPELEATLKNFPKLKIFGHGPAFWAEIAKLITPADRGGYPSYPIVEEGVVPVLLRRYENLYGDLSANSGYNALARDRAYASAFLNEFQDKLLFGTDICSPGQHAPLAGFLSELRESGEISKAVFEKVAHANAERLLGL